MADYELALVTGDDLPEKDKKEIIEKIEKIVTSAEGKVKDVQEWAKKTLAYPIKKHKTANFTFMTFEVDPKASVEIKKQINLSEEVLRSLLTKLEAKKEVKKRTRKVKED